jgi:hypothetical protein
MVLPDRVFVIVSALHAQHAALASGDDDARRSLQKMIVETVVKRHPGEGWGWKRADPGRPMSKDAIANNVITPGHIVAWDCFDGATRAPVQRDSMLIDGQVFVEVSGFDHLNDAVLVPQPRQPDPARSPGAAPAQTVTSAEFFETLNWLDKIYREQMGRANGVDLEGIAAHVYGLYVGERQRGASVGDAKARVVKQINDILGRTDIHV